ESFDHIIYIHTLEKSFDVRKPLKEIETDLPDDFLRISRSVIINKNHVKHINTLTGQKFNIQTTRHMRFIVTKLFYKLFIEKMDLYEDTMIKIIDNNGIVLLYLAVLSILIYTIYLIFYNWYIEKRLNKKIKKLRLFEPIKWIHFVSIPLAILYLISQT